MSRRAGRPGAGARRAARRAAVAHRACGEEDARDYLGARNSRFVLAPGSVLSKRPPRWVVVAELVETSRLYGRIAARIEPEAVERVAGRPGAAHLQRAALGRRTRRGDGLRAGDAVRPAAGGAPARRLRRGRAGGRAGAVHPACAGRGRLADPAPLLPRQRAAARRSSTELEERARRRDLLVGDDEIYALYDARIPADVVSARHFDAWWKKQRHRTPGPADLHPRRPAARATTTRTPIGRTPGRRATWRCR